MAYEDLVAHLVRRMLQHRADYPGEKMYLMPNERCPVALQIAAELVTPHDEYCSAPLGPDGDYVQFLPKRDHLGFADIAI